MIEGGEHKIVDGSVEGTGRMHVCCQLESGLATFYSMSSLNSHVPEIHLHLNERATWAHVDHGVFRPWISWEICSIMSSSLLFADDEDIRWLMRVNMLVSVNGLHPMCFYVFPFLWSCLKSPSSCCFDCFLSNLALLSSLFLSFW